MKRLLCVTICAVLLAGCSLIDRSGSYSQTETLMGTFVQVKIVGPRRSGDELTAAAKDALALAGELEKKFSAFDPASEANALNIARTMEVSPELFDLVKQAKKASRITGGQFDVTVAPILKADGLYAHMPSELRDRIPDGFDGVDWRNVTLRLDGRSIMLRKGAWIDLSGIAKGYIVDKMAGLLKKKNTPGFMINAGGDIYCSVKDGNTPWKIGVRKPGAKSVIATLDVKDMAVATSGDYENVVTDKKTGRVISHIIDPATRKAIKEVPSSITVIAPTCTEADALATGMMAMGKDRAIALADSLEGVEIIVIESPAGRHTISFSRNAAGYVVER